MQQVAVRCQSKTLHGTVAWNAAQPIQVECTVQRWEIWWFIFKFLQ